jgi:hypothetical protein
MTTTESVLLPPFKELHGPDFPGYVRDGVQFRSLNHEVYVLINELHNTMQMQIRDVESSALFGHFDGRPQGMTAWHFCIL